ncbi:MAG: glycerophosphodiester phosphodiesterase family protein, partial [Acidobacteriaceae bacterium]
MRRRSGPLVIAHRGASANAPENTMPAFEAAWAAGCGWVEADVQPTMDNVPVLLHDQDLDRTTTGKGPVRSWSSRDVQSLDAGSWFPTGSTR